MTLVVQSENVVEEQDAEEVHPVKENEVEVVILGHGLVRVIVVVVDVDEAGQAVEVLVLVDEVEEPSIPVV